MPSDNQTPEQAARDKIDKQLSHAGWIVQDNKKIDFSAGFGIAVREYQTDVGPADYVLFVDKKPAGIVEAKREGNGAPSRPRYTRVPLPPKCTMSSYGQIGNHREFLTDDSLMRSGPQAKSG